MTRSTTSLLFHFIFQIIIVYWSHFVSFIHMSFCFLFWSFSQLTWPLPTPISTTGWASSTFVLEYSPSPSQIFLSSGFFPSCNIRARHLKGIKINSNRFWHASLPCTGGSFYKAWPLSNWVCAQKVCFGACGGSESKTSVWAEMFLNDYTPKDLT